MKYGTKSHATKVLAELQAIYPEADCALVHDNPLQLLVATILSAQCTDVRVNIVTQTLFQKFRTAKDFAEVSQEELEHEIHSTGFYRNKAKNIRECCRMIVEKYAGRVPADMESLVALPGVGRKTANCILGNGYGIAEGITVDTHVLRLARRIGLSAAGTPEKVEADLMKIVPREKWIAASHQLIFLGRNICQARKPKCEVCPMNAAKVCRYASEHEA